ncbi:hypothetical protein COCCU_03590 [Corynebacterium occultum]|uniref:Trypsin n=1 Tax=Corynebacterium occultum TaxID=2675219 RepID=A0A6B8W9I8_9CORY|nr:S1 family peptidase [Corynebacterium occultum]QGU06670.1 hypothetical protein COCCU_03590 [Corynebacterium occultum]
MRRKHRLRSFIAAGIMGAAALFAVPAAGADELPDIPASVGEAIQQGSDYARADGPNYHWRNDTSSQVLASSVGDPVLQRVQGSFFDSPDIPQDSHDAQAQGFSLYGPGTPIFVGDTMMCTLGVAGYDAAGRMVGLTAGHCGQPGDVVMSADSWEIGESGRVVSSNAAQDFSVIQFGGNARITNSYNGFRVDSVGGAAPAAGETLCKQGVATGHSCGNVWTANNSMTIAQVCAMQGDSGAPVMRGRQMVGMVSGGLLPYYQLQCQTPLQGQLFMPTVITNMNAILATLNASGGVGAGFRVAG